PGRRSRSGLTGLDVLLAHRVRSPRRLMTKPRASGAPAVREMLVVPVAGHDSMLLNLSGAHAPFFTRNVVVLKDEAGHVGAGEVPGGERIRQTLEEARPLVVGRPIGACRNVLHAVRDPFAAPHAAAPPPPTFHPPPP